MPGGWEGESHVERANQIVIVIVSLAHIQVR